MALICVMSAKGAPGATTTAMLLAGLWPRESVLVDADPMGGDVALRLPAEDGQPLDPDGGLLRLLPLARRGLTPDTVLEACERAQGGQLVLTGLAGPEQAGAVGGLWDEIGRVLGELPDLDVIVDVGQAHTVSSHLPMVRRADVLIVVVRPTVPSVLHTQERMRALRATLSGSDGSVPVGGYVVVQEMDKKQNGRAADAAVGDSLDWMSSFGVIAHDARAARMFDGVPVRRPEHTLLARSGREVIGRIVDVLPTTSAAGGPEATDDPRGESRADGSSDALETATPTTAEPGSRLTRRARRSSGRQGKRAAL